MRDLMVVRSLHTSAHRVSLRRSATPCAGSIPFLLGHMLCWRECLQKGVCYTNVRHIFMDYF